MVGAVTAEVEASACDVGGDEDGEFAAAEVTQHTLALLLTHRCGPPSRTVSTDHWVRRGQLRGGGPEDICAHRWWCLRRVDSTNFTALILLQKISTRALERALLAFSSCRSCHAFPTPGVS